ncbi:MAG TPA: DUF4232 domain-containing protein [Acidimicrobiales bacterium]|nr:DUF4232 domain-containing protein [Acidimicrobiales bacterium]
MCAIRWFLRSWVALMLLAGMGVATSVSSAHRAGAAGVPLCTAQRLSAASSIASRPGGTTVRVVMTNRHHPSCVWSNRTGFQFLTASGAPIGPVVLATPMANPTVPRPVYMTFQIVTNVTTMEGVLCTVKVARQLRVTTPDRHSFVLRLRQTVGVCVGGTTKWTTVGPAVFPVAARCSTSMLTVGFGPASGAAGTTYLPLRFTNVSATPCVLSGTPTVQPLSGAQRSSPHVAIGPAARLIDLSSQGFGNPVRLAPRDVASAPYGVVEALNYPSSRCAIKTVQSVRIGLAHVGTWWLPAAFSVCTKLASTTISGIVPGADGLKPTS